ncbi:hypothetical protein KSP39_PZI000215 [Platanthera zijinensis]|uniref:Upstream activation factor subunit spp27 n=1 Tax=Platanthera zijinensis TaxID=2320716 RepID=A0AAP0GG80_9ASPA
MASEAELVDRLRDILRSSDLSTTTAAIVRRKLETDFGVDLSEKKAFIREQIDIFLGELNEIDVEGKTEGGEGDEVKPEEEEEGGSGGEEVDEEDKVEEKEGSINAGSGSRKRSSDKPTAEVKKRGGGFTKLCSLSPQLQEFVSVPELARTEVVKRLWAHIRENNLQDPTDKRKIICDERLLNLFKVKKIDMFQMNKALSKHIWTLAPENVEAEPKETPQKKMKDDKDDTSRKGKRQKKDYPERRDDTAGEGKPQKGGNSGFLTPLPLSDALTKFFGTGETELSRSDVVKRLWHYIKGNNLQDPSDKRIIICDARLKELFQLDSFHGFSVAKLLTAHILKRKTLSSNSPSDYSWRFQVWL